MYRYMCVYALFPFGLGERRETMVSSVRWGYVRIITGTLVGGILGFYVMHRAELSYKEKWNERLKKYEEELNKKKEKANELEESL